MLGSTLPVGLTRVDCDGDESSLLQCTSVSSHAEITFRKNGGDTFDACTRLNSFGDALNTDSTILACGDSSGSVLSPSKDAVIDP